MEYVITGSEGGVIQGLDKSDGVIVLNIDWDEVEDGNIFLIEDYMSTLEELRPFMPETLFNAHYAELSDQLEKWTGN